jgi:hypothetical protein
VWPAYDQPFFVRYNIYSSPRETEAVRAMRLLRPWAATACAGEAGTSLSPAYCPGEGKPAGTTTHLYGSAPQRGKAARRAVLRSTFSLARQRAVSAARDPEPLWTGHVQ